MNLYVPPTSDQPHAIVKFRRLYQSAPGKDLTEELIINNELAYWDIVGRREANVARTDALLVHPGTANIKLDVEFSHEETDYEVEEYECGSDDDPRTCTRVVSDSYTVTDGGCEKELGVRFDAGQIYLLQLEYLYQYNCSVRCMIQEPLGQGELKLRACVVVYMKN